MASASRTGAGSTGDGVEGWWSYITRCHNHKLNLDCLGAQAPGTYTLRNHLESSGGNWRAPEDLARAQLLMVHLAIAAYSYRSGKEVLSMLLPSG